MVSTIIIDVLILFTLGFGIKLSKPSSFNEDYLGVKSTQSIKGFLALCIVACHELGSAFPSIGCLYQVALAAFFFVSGYGLMYGYLNKENYLKHFFRNRCASILTPYFTAFLLYLVYYLLTDGLTHGFLETVSGKFLFVRYSWFVYTILLFYIAFYIIMRLSKNKVLAFALFAGVALAYPVVMKLCGYKQYWYENFFAFFAGLLWCYKKDLIDSFLKKRFFISLVVLAAAVAGLFAAAPVCNALLGFAPEILFVNLRFCVEAMLLFALMTRVKIGNRVLDFLGKMSYEIYLLHGLVRFVVYLTPINEQVGHFVVFIATILLSCAMSLVNTRLTKFIRTGSKGIA